MREQIKPYNKVKFNTNKTNVITKWLQHKVKKRNKQRTSSRNPNIHRRETKLRLKIRYDQSPNTNRSRIISI